MVSIGDDVCVDGLYWMAKVIMKRQGNPLLVVEYISYPHIRRPFIIAPNS
jgi:hypothetical protein